MIGRWLMRWFRRGDDQPTNSDDAYEDRAFQMDMEERVRERRKLELEQQMIARSLDRWSAEVEAAWHGQPRGDAP